MTEDTASEKIAQALRKLADQIEEESSDASIKKNVECEQVGKYSGHTIKGTELEIQAVIPSSYIQISIQSGETAPDWWTELQ
jgi:hypothetical protein